MKPYKPLLAPNNTVSFKKGKVKTHYAGDLKYPILASDKLDGIRCIFYKGQMLSRSLKPIVNKQLREKFAPLIQYSEEKNLLLDGELYCDEIPFSLISSMVMTIDYNDKKATKKWEEKCEEHNVSVSREEALEYIKFYCFDTVKDDNFTEKFIDRSVRIANVKADNTFLIENVLHVVCKDMNALKRFYEMALNDGKEGLILRDPHAKYKFGRGTLNEGIIYKLKPYETFDAKILEVIQATRVDPNAEKKINELGNSVTSKKKGDRIPIEMASAFKVAYGDTFVHPVIALTEDKKKEIWKNREQYIGKTIEYKGLLVGAKEVPRHPVVVRFREDKDE